MCRCAPRTIWRPCAGCGPGPRMKTVDRWRADCVLDTVNGLRAGGTMDTRILCAGRYIDGYRKLSARRLRCLTENRLRAVRAEQGMTTIASVRAVCWMTADTMLRAVQVVVTDQHLRAAYNLDTECVVRAGSVVKADDKLRAEPWVETDCNVRTARSWKP